MSEEEEKAHETHLTSYVYVTDTPVSAPNGLIDTACAKTVAGDAWAGAVTEYCDAEGLPYWKVEESEPFRFGPGVKIWSKYALIIPLLWGKTPILLRVSIVAKEVPCLISRPVMQRLGGVVVF